METRDRTLVRKLHSMRAARGVFEHESGRWLITRITLDGDAPESHGATWSVFGTRARR